MTKKSLCEELNKLGYIALDGFKGIAAPGDIRVYKSGGVYVTTLNLKNGKLTWNGENYTNSFIPSLMQKIEEYNKTLEFDANTYCPEYAKEAVTDMRLCSTLEKCGFEDIGLSGYNGIHGHSNGLLGAKFTSVSGSNLIIGPYSFIQMYEDDASDSVKCKSIKSMMNAFYVSQIAKILQTLDKMGNITESLKSIPITKINPDNGQVTTEEGVDGIISILEDTLARLKK